MRAVALFALVAVTLAATCPPGYHKKAGGCPSSMPTADDECCKCNKGTYNQASDRSSCENCMVGRFSAEYGATSSLTCKICTAGWYHPTDDNVKATKVAATQQEDVCTQCPAGRFNSEANKQGNAASSCTVCPAGHFRENPEATKVADCEKCVSTTMKMKKNEFGFFITGAINATGPNGACEPRTHDCIMSEWSDFGRCSLMCGGGTQMRSRTMIRNATNGAATNAACKLTDTRKCNTAPCSTFNDRYPDFDELGNGLWWEMTFPSNAPAGLPADMNAECRRQTTSHTGPLRFESLRSGVQNGYYTTLPNGILHTQNSPVNGWCCKITTDGHEKVGETICGEAKSPASLGTDQMLFLGQVMNYNDQDGTLCKDGTSTGCAQIKPIFVHKQECAHTTCSVEVHNCSVYDCRGAIQNNSKWEGSNTHLGGYCPNQGIGACDGTMHTTIRVNHPGHLETGDADGHFCHVTEHRTPVTDSICKCFCLDVYKRQSHMSSLRHQRLAQHSGASAQAIWKNGVTYQQKTGGDNTNSDNTNIVNPHFNHGDSQTHGALYTKFTHPE